MKLKTPFQFPEAVTEAFKTLRTRGFVVAWKAVFEGGARLRPRLHETTAAAPGAELGAEVCCRSA